MTNHSVKPSKKLSNRKLSNKEAMHHLGILTVRNGQLLKKMEGMVPQEDFKGIVNLLIESVEQSFGEGSSAKVLEKMNAITTKRLADAALKEVGKESVPDKAEIDTVTNA